MEHIKINDDIHILGRTTFSEGRLNLFHTGSGVEFSAAASEVWAVFISDYSLYEPWISVELNGALISRVMLTKGKNRICLFRGLNPETPKTVRILKETQAMSDDPDSLLQLEGLEAEGKILPVKPKKLKIEFIGDSITAGEGIIGAKCEEDWASVFMTAALGYPVKTADALDADFRIIAQSGWGVLSSWDNNPNKAIPLYYEQICGMAQGERSIALGAKEKYDFGGRRADAVVINLGTNDESAFHQPMWQDESGAVFKQRLDKSGAYNYEDAERFINAAADFLRLVRKNNPSAYIVWCFGMLGDGFIRLIKEAVKRYKRESLDKRVSVLRLSQATENSIGSRQHPGLKCHQRAASRLTAYLNDVLKRSE